MFVSTTFDARKLRPAGAFVAILLGLVIVCTPSHACSDSTQRVAELKKLSESKRAAISRIRFREEDGRPTKISQAELLRHVAQLADFTLGKVTAEQALADGNVFFRSVRSSKSRPQARVELTRFLERVSPDDVRPMDLWLQKMIEAHFRTQTFKGKSYDEARRIAEQAAQVMVVTHGTARAQLEVLTKYPDHRIVYLVSPLEPLQPGILYKADLVLFSDGGETDLVTVAPSLNFAGGEVFFCQTQTLAGLVKHSKAQTRLDLHVDADLSYTEQDTQRIRLRQDAYPRDVHAALVEIQHELDLFMADHGYFSDPIEPSEQQPLPFTILYEQERKRPGPKNLRVVYE